MRQSAARFPAAVFVVSLAAAVAAAAPAAADVFLSELCDPQNNYTTDRYIEIFNSGPGTVDLTNWRIVAIGNSADVNTWTLTGTIAPGEARVAGSTAPVTAFPIHYASASWLTNYFNWNGNIGDGAKLINASNVVLDLVVAPASGLFENKTMVRNPDITAPNPVYTASEWTSTPVLTAPAATPGSHNGSIPPAGGPIVSNIVTDPASPAAGVPVDVEATVVDTSGAIQAVTLSWGTSAGSQPNVIGMPLLSGDTYRTSAQIPGQLSGVTIHYRILAEGAVANTQSAIQSYTIPGGGTGVPASILAVGEMSDSTLLVFFSEPVEETTAEAPGNYAVGALTGVAAERDPANTAQVLVTIRGIQAGTRTLTVSGVSDLDGNFTVGATRTFNYVDVTIPAGYYDGVTGLSGMALRHALRDLIDGHTAGSYSGALTSFQKTDIKPNGKVWDMYSDIPGGTPPYEYSFGQTGQGGSEGLGYNREHTFPASWFGDATPMYTDLWNLTPTDSRVNGYRGNYPFGEVTSPTITSWNGCKVGPSTSPGYFGTVFEPIDAYKGDLVRMNFYMCTRYFQQDASWPGSPSIDGAEMLPWAVAQYLEWAQADPVSWKERMRNGAIYTIQGNRNPFIDHPEFLTLIYDSTSVVGVDGDAVAAGWTLRLRANVPNPFQSRTTITFDLARSAPVSLDIYDVTGRRVRALLDGNDALGAGAHTAEWNGLDDGGRRVAAGLYFARLSARGEAVGTAAETRRMVVSR